MLREYGTRIGLGNGSTTGGMTFDVQPTPGRGKTYKETKGVNMSEREYWIRVISDFYLIGEEDLFFLNDLIGLVSYGENDNFLDKSSEKRIDHAIFLANYLLSTCDFEAGVTVSSGAKGVDYVKFDGDINIYFDLIRKDVRANGLDDFETGVRYWISKIKGRRMNSIPPVSLSDLFEN